MTAPAREAASGRSGSPGGPVVGSSPRTTTVAQLPNGGSEFFAIPVKCESKANGRMRRRLKEGMLRPNAFDQRET